MTFLEIYYLVPGIMLLVFGIWPLSRRLFKNKVARNQRLAFVLLCIGASLMDFGFFYDAWRALDLRFNGTRGTARVISAKRGWTQVNRYEEVILQVEVEVPDGKSFQTEIRRFVAPFAAQMMVGSMGRIRVLYDPESLDFAISDPNPY